MKHLTLEVALVTLIASVLLCCCAAAPPPAPHS